MDNKTLAVKYRPTSWDDLTEQDYIKQILDNQIITKTVKNAYLFCGPAGCGKTTSARIFAKRVNNNIGNPIEVDAASNNGVEQIRTIIDDAKFKPLDSEYKIYIMDECHMLSNGAWNAMLKLLEEPPKTTIFILCTTDPQKIPKTILSRVQRYDFQKISYDGIVNRLKFILNQEKINSYDEEALKYIAKLSEGGMRDAISSLDKVLSFNKHITIETVLKSLGISNYENLNNLLDYLLNSSSKESIEIIENIYKSGKDLKLFIKQFISFILDVCKYLIYNDYDYIQIPSTINLTGYNKYDFELILLILDKVIQISNNIKYESNPKVLIESELLLICKEIKEL